MTAAIPIGILGLSRLGTSIGLAIKRFAAGKEAKQSFTITGYDTAPNNGPAAKSAKAIDALAKSAAECAADKAIVVLALPPGEVTGGLKAIEAVLHPGTVILDFSAFKRSAAAWGQQAVSRDLHLIGVTALYNPIHLFSGLEMVESAAADLFDGGHLLVAGAADAAPEAVEVIPADQFAREGNWEGRQLLSPEFGYVNYFLRTSHLQQVAAILDDPAMVDVSLDEYVRRAGFGRDFVQHYLIPMSSAVWSTPPDQMLRFPASTLVRFFKNHGFLGLNTQHQWYTVDGGCARIASPEARHTRSAPADMSNTLPQKPKSTPI